MSTTLREFPRILAPRLAAPSLPPESAWDEARALDAALAEWRWSDTMLRLVPERTYQRHAMTTAHRAEVWALLRDLSAPPHIQLRARTSLVSV